MNLKNSPWGEVQSCSKMENVNEEVFIVSTESHGGLVLREENPLQKRVEDLYGESKLYQNWVEKRSGLVFYEEDCACLLATINPAKYKDHLDNWLNK